MQKLITVNVNTKQLLQNPDGPFSINEVEVVNELLELGWEIEEWKILKDIDTDGQILLLVILTDEAIFDNDEDLDEFDFQEGEDEEDDSIDMSQGRRN